MILYPTETVYALGVNPFNPIEMNELYEYKGRDGSKIVSWLVRDISDIERWGVLSPVAREIALRWLPGPLTLAIPAKDIVPVELRALDGTVSFRISSDAVSQKVISEYMAKNDTPLTCTSANISGMPTLSTVSEIVDQFIRCGRDVSSWQIHDSGMREGVVSTVVKIINDDVTIVRQGAVIMTDILT
jgi:L-threonylcarbamoyladenylate synthase